ncbi:hypothetical protein [Marinobacter salinus]|nr:hypothetical protein [Marinobacter salinus]
MPMPVKPDSGREPELEAKVAFLSRPDSYIEHPAHVETVETHMSWVFMTERFVYKLKKPVKHSFLDFSTLDDRRRDCLEEVRLNRRLAPDVYLGIIAITRDTENKLELDGDGEITEWLVKMRRLPADRMLDHLLRGQRIPEQEIRRFSCKLADFYRNAPPVHISAYDYRQQFLTDIHSNREELLDHDYRLPANLLDRITNSQLDVVCNQPELLDQRVKERRIVEAHGDLRPEHICLTEEPVFIDCLEFNRKLRILDPADELAYLAMECQLAGGEYIGPIVFACYSRKTGDDPPQPLLYFYKAYRATLRAKLSIWHIKDHSADQHQKWISRAKAYLHLADSYRSML